MADMVELMAAVDAAVAVSRKKLDEQSDFTVKLMICAKVVAPLIAAQLYPVIKAVYGERALYTKGDARVQIDCTRAGGGEDEPASIIFGFDHHRLECLLADGTTYSGTCAQLVDWLKEHVPEHVPLEEKEKVHNVPS